MSELGFVSIPDEGFHRIKVNDDIALTIEDNDMVRIETTLCDTARHDIHLQWRWDWTLTGLALMDDAPSEYRFPIR